MGVYAYLNHVENEIKALNRKIDDSEEDRKTDHGNFL